MVKIILLIIGFFTLLLSGIFFDFPVSVFITSALLSLFVIIKLFMRLRQPNVFNSDDIDKIRRYLKRSGVISGVAFFWAWVLFEDLNGPSEMITVCSFFLLGSWIGLLLQLILAPSEESVYNREMAENAYTNRSLELQAIIKKYREYKQQANIPNNANTVEISQNCPQLGILEGKHYIWTDSNNLYLFPYICESSTILKSEIIYPLVTVPKNLIEYFSTDGEVYRENKISGGGGGGSSVSGAIIGGIVAGSAGAIIGSRKKTEEIKSELITHDTRQVYINIFDINEHKFSLRLRFSCLSVLQTLLPEKEFSIVNAIKQQHIIQEELCKSNHSSFDRETS